MDCLAPYYQLIAGIFLGVALLITLSLVRREKMSDKYGLSCSAFLAAAIVFNLSFKWASVSGSPEGDFLLGLFFMAGISMVISYVVRQTQHSKERRQYIQEVALLRFQLEELSRKFAGDSSTPEENWLRR